MICKKHTIQGIQKDKFLLLSCRVTLNLYEETAKLRNDKSMITAIASKPLIAKEFKNIIIVFRDYTHIVSSNSNSGSSFRGEYLFAKGDYKTVCQIIDQEI